MDKPKRFTLISRAKSFRYAISGLKLVIAREHNFWIHLIISLVVIVAGIVLGISVNDWLWLVVAIAIVLIAEMLNTSIEIVCNAITLERHTLIKEAKDIAAGAVLISAAAAATIGILVFWPYLPIHD